MSAVLRLLFLVIFALSARGAEFKLYATLLENTPVVLGDGARWAMDKGDTFPVLMYKERQTKIVLQLGGTSFMVDTKVTRLLKDEEIPAGLANYRKNVATYISGTSDKWKDSHDPKKKQQEPGKP